MNSNNLMALIAALAIVPLYFKEPSQPAPEKWKYACLEYWIGDPVDGEIIVSNSDGNMRIATRGAGGPWRLRSIETTPPANGNPSSSTETASEELGLGVTGRFKAESAAHRFYLSEINRMEKEGWIPFAAHPAGEMAAGLMDRSTIYYRRRVQ